MSAQNRIPTAFQYALSAGAGNGEALRFAEWKIAYLPTLGVLEAWHAWVDASPVKYIGA